MTSSLLCPLCGLGLARLLSEESQSLESRDLLDGVTRLAQHLVGMLADGRRADRSDLVRIGDVERARYGEALAVGEGHQRADLARLGIVGSLVDRSYLTERDAGLFEDRPPFRQVALGEDFVEDPGQGDGILPAGVDRGEARVLQEMAGADCLEKYSGLPRIVQRHQEPATVAGAIVIGERARRLDSRRPMADLLAEQAVLHVAAVGP